LKDNFPLFCQQNAIHVLQSKTVQQLASLNCRSSKAIWISHGQPSLCGLAWAGGWTRWSPEGPSNLSHSMSLWFCDGVVSFPLSIREHVATLNLKHTDLRKYLLHTV